MCGKCIDINTKTANALHNFALWLSDHMIESDTTDAELAQYVGVERKTVYAWRHGERFPKLDQLVMVFDYFDENWVQIPFFKEFGHGNGKEM